MCCCPCLCYVRIEQDPRTSPCACAFNINVRMLCLLIRPTCAPLFIGLKLRSKYGFEVLYNVTTQPNHGWLSVNVTASTSTTVTIKGRVIR